MGIDNLDLSIHVETGEMGADSVELAVRMLNSQDKRSRRKVCGEINNLRGLDINQLV
jgi:hypothetical protein